MSTTKARRQDDGAVVDNTLRSTAVRAARRNGVLGRPRTQRRTRKVVVYKLLCPYPTADVSNFAYLYRFFSFQYSVCTRQYYLPAHKPVHLYRCPNTHQHMIWCTSVNKSTCNKRSDKGKCVEDPLPRPTRSTCNCFHDTYGPHGSREWVDTLLGTTRLEYGLWIAVDVELKIPFDNYDSYIS